tara:strand:- start:422 stop:3055 length:2634 start_codon:yes stop_codon:yes gene_type:complete
MAIQFSSFSHWSSESNLPSFSISGGNEVIDQWRSPYDPTLWYLHNISDEGDRTTTRTSQAPYGKSILVNPSTSSFANAGSGPAVEGYDQGVRYDGFLRSGDYNVYKFTRDTSPTGYSGIGVPNIDNALILGGSGSSSSPRTDVSRFYEELPRKNNSGAGQHGGYHSINRYTWGAGSDHTLSSSWSPGVAPHSSSYTSNVTGALGNNWDQSATSKILKYGRLYYQYDGGQSTEAQPFSSPAGYSASFDMSTMTWRYNYLSWNNGDSRAGYYPAMNYPEVWMQDARFKWSDNKSTLRESEIKILDPSPIKKLNNAARGWTRWPTSKPTWDPVVGVTSHFYAMEAIRSATWNPQNYDPDDPWHTVGGTWSDIPGNANMYGIGMDADPWLYGEASTDYYNDGGVGHSQVWGRNICIGNGMMFFGKYGDTYNHRNEGTFSSIDGGHDAVGWGIIPYHGEQDGKFQGPDHEREVDPEATFFEEQGYVPTDLHPWHVMDYDKWFQYDPEPFPALPEQNDGDSSGPAQDKWILRIVDMAKGCRMKTSLVAYDVDLQLMLFAVGNGRLYTVRKCYDSVNGSDNYDSLFFNHGVRPYPVSLNGFTRGASRYGMEIMDMSGVTRKCVFSPNGGVQFNYGNITSGTGMYGSPSEDSFQYYISVITAGCGRLAVSAPYYRHRYDDMPSSREEYGMVWLMTQDGQFIKTLSFRDESWSTRGNANGGEIRFGDKIAIKNNLIFVLASDFDMSLQFSAYFKDTNYTNTEAAHYTWGGKGRMYIYSLDGELLAAFSPYNLGFKNQEDYSTTFSFDDFLTDGVNLYIFDNCTKKLGELNEHYVAGTLGVEEAVEQAEAGYSISASVISKNTQVMHLKLPESITKYYDEISEMYRY